jgi:hypothetical protein
MKTGEQVNIFVGGEEISRVATCKFLGLSSPKTKSRDE